jgi:hypothetical protein
MKSKIHEIRIADIDLIEGGILSGNQSKPIMIHDSVNDVMVGISVHIKNYNKLVTIILSNVKKDVYDNVLSKAKEVNELNKEMYGIGKNKKPTKK